MGRKSGIAIILIWCFILSAGGCNKATAPAEDDPVKIGYISETFVIARWQRDRDAFSTRAKALGAEVLVYNTYEDSEEQIQVMEELIQEDVDVIVITPYDKDALAAAIKKAKDKGIKVIAYDRLIMNADIDLYISFDNYAVGQLMAENLLAVVPTGRYAVINGSPYDNNSNMLRDGYMDVLNAEVEAGRVEIVGPEFWSDDWRSEFAYEYISNLLAAGEQLDAIIGANDLLAEGAITALSENMLAGKVMVSGQDTELAACQRIVEGTQYVSIYKPIPVLAEGAAEAAVKMAKGETVQNNDMIDNGMRMVPYLKYPPIAVTKENIMDTVIDDGFHPKEEVYRNIPEKNWPK